MVPTVKPPWVREFPAWSVRWSVYGAVPTVTLLSTVNAALRRL